jgi:uncharacterized membrane protein YhaH (DUF805 family)
MELTQSERMNDRDIVVTLVHGTFSPKADWIKKDSPLAKHIIDTLKKDDREVYIKPFEWSGKNSIFARVEAAKSLRSHLTDIENKFPSLDHYMVAHSHGGNIALYALSGAGNFNVKGIMCLSTPFITARVRDLSAFKGRRLYQAVSMAVAVMTLFLSTIFYDFFYSIILTLIGAMFGYGLAPLLEKIVQAYVPMAQQFAELITARPQQGAKLVIVRAVGDEATFALGTAQFLLWGSAKAFELVNESVNEAHSPTRIELPRYKFRTNASFNKYKRKAIQFLWFLFVLIFFISLIIVATTRTARQIHVIGAPSQVILSLKIAVFGTIFVWTNLIDGPVLGALFILLLLCIFMNMHWLGTKPAENDIPGVRDRFERFALGMIISLIINVNAELAPPGRAEIIQLDNGRHSKAGHSSLSHSVYDDECLKEIVTDWLCKG